LGDGIDVAGRVHFAEAAIAEVVNVDVVAAIDGDAEGALSLAAVAAPVSPENPAMPVPAKVVRFPLMSTFDDAVVGRSAK